MKAQPLFHALDLTRVFAAVESSPKGLSQAEAERRQATIGRNILPSPASERAIGVLLRQLGSFLIVILIVAAFISFLLGDVPDGSIILAAVFVNVIVGFVQERKASKALEALRKIITVQATVFRDSKEEILDMGEVVPGDMIEVSAGDRVPADARLVAISELEVNEAVLTGESASVSKQTEPVFPSAALGDRTNMIFTGTTVVRGSAQAVVVTTGLQTEIGHIASLLKQTKDPITPLQQKLNQFSKFVGMAVLLVCAGVFIVGFLKGVPFIDMFTTSVAIAVSAIPEGLAVAVTIILAVGMQRILKRHALVRHLQAAETLGSTSVICTDKTGTLTEGHMHVVSLVTHDYHFTRLHQIERHEIKGLEELIFALTIGALCNDARVVYVPSPEEVTVVGNLTERALLTAAMNVGLDHQKLATAEPRMATVPFDSKTKYMATLHKHPKRHRRIYLKGAPELVIAMCTTIRTGARAQRFTAKQRRDFEEKFVQFSEEGLRILALAYRDMPKDYDTLRREDCQELTFVGFVGIQDPLRKQVKEMVQETRRAGITTVMITGDHPLTARTIARQLGLPTGEQNIIDGEQLHTMSQEQLNRIVEEVSVYARVSPEDKLNIIQAWQSKGRVVAMTGDGVNDAPALKAANIGIALGSGTDVAKEASDMVLLDDRFESIVAAVEEGRGIFDNIRTVVLYLVSDSFAEVILITLSLLGGFPLPLTAAQILWINLVADGLPNIALTVDPKDPRIMEDRPRKLHEPVLNGEMKVLVGAISLWSGITNLIAFLYFWKVQGDLDLARSVVFATLTFDSLLYVFSIRSLRRPLFHRRFFTNPWLFAAVLAAFLLQLAAFTFPSLRSLLHTVPLGWLEWSIVGVLAVSVVILTECLKFIFSVARKYQH